ncbi:hypothetical protein [Gordonia sp. (in: high G+C Gram-positive bacteria)]|uniref:hypothetical protein n=1 Tax=Gordonia sp. (in: high G+C Gram-positive bacteria) TaxID=84139 RepID=UPI003F9A3E44
MTRTMKLTATAVLGLSLALSAAACGDEQEAPSAESSTTSVAAPPSDRSVPVVPGPKPKSSTATSTSAERESTPDDAESCGAAKGPDGALQIRLVEGDITCDTAKGIAKEYSPLIATGQPQDVKGWQCGPSTTVGELARCTKDSQAFALVP